MYQKPTNEKTREYTILISSLPKYLTPLPSNSVNVNSSTINSSSNPASQVQVKMNVPNSAYIEKLKKTIENIETNNNRLHQEFQKEKS